ncbi:hypothetical protein CYG49_01450 [Candidatus Saccharibacteria bacterium]|nr:MAG: hypothetical protein CYG49_01450 [Candidatus Saccharibacteria bacterium]
MKAVPKKLREDPLWKETLALTEYMYGKVDELTVNYPEEEWASANKLRNSANDSLFYVAQALGNTEASASEYDWSYARKNLFSTETMYIFATKQKLIDLEPEIVVRIDRLIEAIDSLIEKAKEDAETKTKRELEPWLEKYRLWQQMQEK